MRGAVALLGLAHLASASTDPTYDQQKTTYLATFAPVTTHGAVPIAPFFSPEHSTDTLTELIEQATKSVDIFTPSAGSWLSACGGYVDDDGTVDDTTVCAPGCTPEEQRAETFPIFPALLNALHRGIRVRLVTNDYGTPDCNGIDIPASLNIRANHH